MFELFIVLDQVFGMFLLREQFFEALVGSLPHSFIHPPDQIEHNENDF